MPPQAGEVFSLLINLVRVVDFFRNEFKFILGIIPQRPIKARFISNVALALLNGYFENEAILVAIDEYLPHFLDVSAFFALFP